MICLLLLLAYGGVAAFALAMAPHHRTVFGHVPGARVRRCWRFAGTILVLFALWPAVTPSGWAVGLVTWVSGLCLAGFVLTQMLTFAPRWLLAPAGLASLALVATLLLAGEGKPPPKSADAPPVKAVTRNTISQ